MKRFIGFTRKEFYHIFRDRRSLLILFGMPVVQVLLFGFAITNEINNVDISILDKARDPLSKQIIDRIDASPYFSIEDRISNDAAIEDMFRTGAIKAAIIFPEDFSQRLKTTQQAHVQTIVDASEPNTANAISSYVEAILKDQQADLNHHVHPPYVIAAETRMVFNAELKSVFMFVPGVITVILMLVSAMMTSISITREKEMGTMEVLLVSPLTPLQVVLGKVVPYVLLSIINAAVIIALGYFVFGMPVNGSWVLLGFECILFILCALALGILISTMARTQQTAMMVSLAGLMLPVILLSGFIFPITSMPDVLQWLSNIIPARWFIDILKGIMLKGVGLAFLWKPTLILLAMTVFFLAVSAFKYKIRLE